MVVYIEQIKQAQVNEKPKPRVPNYIASCILKIATRLSGKHNYMNNSHYREEMIMDGVENCLRYIANFDPTKSNNPFAYFTQIVTNAFNRRIEKEKKEDYIKHKYTQYNNVVLGNEEVVVDGSNDEVNTMQNHESISDFITSFEQHMDRKKQKRKKGLEKLIEDDEEVQDV